MFRRIPAKKTGGTENFVKKRRSSTWRLVKGDRPPVYLLDRGILCLGVIQVDITDSLTYHGVGRYRLKSLFISAVSYTGNRLTSARPVRRARRLWFIARVLLSMVYGSVLCEEGMDSLLGFVTQAVEEDPKYRSWSSRRASRPAQCINTR